MLSVSEGDRYIGTRDKVAVDNHFVRYPNAGDFLKVHMAAPSLISSNVFYVRILWRQWIRLIKRNILATSGIMH